MTRELFAQLKRYLPGRCVIAPVSHSDIETYFSTTEAAEAITTFARCHAIMVGRKLIRKTRKDVGQKRAGKLGLPSNEGVQ